MLVAPESALGGDFRQFLNRQMMFQRLVAAAVRQVDGYGHTDGVFNGHVIAQCGGDKIEVDQASAVEYKFIPESDEADQRGIPNSSHRPNPGTRGPTSGFRYRRGCHSSQTVSCVAILAVLSFTGISSRIYRLYHR
jgi:hypothetical protein